MRSILIVSALVAAFAVGCQKKSSEVPEPPTATNSVVSEEPFAPPVAPMAREEGESAPDGQESGCATEACETACADVAAELHGACRAAFVAGCFSGSAPADFPCGSFGPAAQPDEAEPARRIPAKGSVIDAVKPKGSRGRSGAGVGFVPDDDDDPSAKPTPIGD